jgi:Mrp family chromosome partitioning ATPase
MGVFGAEGRNSFSEAFRLLRGRIYRNVTPGVSTLIMIISASKEDGKTTIAANLSKVLADDSKRVLLVDADLHLSRLRRILKTETKPGLTDWLMTGQKPEIEKWPGELFDVLPVGMSLLPGRDRLDDKALAAIIENLRADYEFLVLDCPPLPTVSDGMTLGVFADLILSVISVSHTPKQTLKTHNELIDALQRPHGIIINEVINEYQDESDAYFLG